MTCLAWQEDARNERSGRRRVGLGAEADMVAFQDRA